MSERPMTLGELIKALDARLIAMPAELPPACPSCGCITEQSLITDTPALCLTCTWSELPGTPADNAVRIENRMTWGQYWGRVERFGTVWQNPKAWATPKSRQRR